ncbi:hypothetical protein VTK56DRAFT_8931 [Thermocarpiscus australiensis]
MNEAKAVDSQPGGALGRKGTLERGDDDRDDASSPAQTHSRPRRSREEVEADQEPPTKQPKQISGGTTTHQTPTRIRSALRAAEEPNAKINNGAANSQPRARITCCRARTKVLDRCLCKPLLPGVGTASCRPETLEDWWFARNLQGGLRDWPQASGRGSLTSKRFIRHLAFQRFFF